MVAECGGKVALVTGASRGLGKAIAQRLAVAGATVALGDLPDGPPFSEFHRAAGFGIYGTVKAALNLLTKSLASELYDDASP